MFAALRLTGLFCLPVLCLLACNTPDAEFDAPINPERIAFSAERQYPEGIAYAPTISQFLVSSITQGKVGLVDQGGRYRDFLLDSKLISAIGLKVRNNRVYVCNGDQGVSDKSTAQTTLKTAGLFVFNLANGQLIRSIRLDTLLPGASHYANDLAFDEVGNAYVTDSFSPVIYKVTPDFIPSIFINSPLFLRRSGINLNGIVYHPDKYLLVVKANEGLLFKVDIQNPANITQVTGETRQDGTIANISLPDGDGMVLYNNDLYVVNGRNRVSQLRSMDGWRTASVVKTDTVGYAQSTTNVQVGGQIYTLNARIGEVSAAVAAQNPALLRARDYSIQQFK